MLLYVVLIIWPSGWRAQHCHDWKRPSRIQLYICVELQCYLHCKLTGGSWVHAFWILRCNLHEHSVIFIFTLQVLVHPSTPNGTRSRYLESEKKVYRPKQMIASFLLQGNPTAKQYYVHETGHILRTSTFASVCNVYALSFSPALFFRNRNPTSTSCLCCSLHLQLY